MLPPRSGVAELQSWHSAHPDTDAGISATINLKTVRSSRPNKRCRRARQDNPEFGKLTGLGIDLYRAAMLLDNDVVTNGEA
jgi:hypothetical protein